MMPCFIATLVAKEGQESELEKLQDELARLTDEHEPDTLVYDVLRHRETSRTYVVYARFRDEAAFETHQASSFHDDLVPPILATLDVEMDLQFYDGISVVSRTP